MCRWSLDECHGAQLRYWYEESEDAWTSRYSAPLDQSRRKAAVCGYCVVIRIAVSAENNCIIFLIKYRSFLQWKKSSSEQCGQGEEGKGVLSHSGVLVVAEGFYLLVCLWFPRCQVQKEQLFPPPCMRGYSSAPELSGAMGRGQPAWLPVPPCALWHHALPRSTKCSSERLFHSWGNIAARCKQAPLHAGLLHLMTGAEESTRQSPSPYPHGCPHFSPAARKGQMLCWRPGCWRAVFAFWEQAVTILRVVME